MDDKLKKIREVAAKINADNKKRTKDDEPLVSVAADIISELEPTYVPTNVAEVNAVLGGGFPRGNTSAIHGQEGSGKTAIALSVAANLTQNGEYVLFINTEGSFPLDQAKAVGVQLDKLIYVPAKDYAEKLVDTIDAYLFDVESRKPTGYIGGVIIDSINGLVAKAVTDAIETEGSEKTTQMARRAKLLDDLLSRLYGRGMLRSNPPVTVIIVAQDRFNIGAYGAPLKMSGGQAALYMPKVRVRLNRTFITRKEKIGDKSVDVPIGHTVDFLVEKNNVNSHLGRVEYSVLYGHGIDDSGTLLKRLDEYKFISKLRKKPCILLGSRDLIFDGGIAELRAAIKSDLSLKEEVRGLLKKHDPKTTPVLCGNEVVYETDPFTDQEENA